ncbi:MAG: glycerol-3-phosphate dehydrogenase/oxidase [Gammaproteobacteria bacterium]
MSLRREDVVARIRTTPNFDVIVIGGGANGAGIALDAASRGLSVALFERGAFGSGTSSRSSKIIHGGVRYLALGHWGLVRESLRERATLLANAPAIVRPLRFVLPCYSRFERLKYRCGLALYDWFAGDGLRTPSRTLDGASIAALTPGLSRQGLRGAVCYEDAAFDDARLLLCVLAQARAAGAATLNHAEVIALDTHSGGAIRGVVVKDQVGGQQWPVAGRVVINACGPYGDGIRHLESDRRENLMAPSQGAHVVVPGRFLGGDAALVFPQTPDGRIMFAIPWHGRVLLGTTETPREDVPAQPLAFDHEIDQILDVAGRFLDPAPRRADVTSVFAGLRPLVDTTGDAPSAKRSREHLIDVSAAGLVSVSGGKWTTYRLIAEQTVDLAINSGGLSAPPSRTGALPLATAPGDSPYAAYGADSTAVAALASETPALASPLHPDLPYSGADYVWAARAELACHVTDALTSHTRALFLDAAAASAIVPRVAELMAAELGRDADWVAREVAVAEALARDFSLTPIPIRDKPG